MPEMNIQSLDLNLLKTLHALLSERSVSRAAETLGTSQPTVSRSLARLRSLFSDRLLVPSGRELVLTPRAQAMVEPLSRALSGVQSLLVSPIFDPQTAKMTLRLCTFDYGAMVLVPALMKILGEEAPGITLEVLTAPAQRTEETLRDDIADLVLGSLETARTEFRKQHLFEDTLVCLARHNHPRLRDGLNSETFQALSHLIVTSAHSPLEEAMAKRYLKVALRLPHYAAAPSVMVQTDLLLTLPSRVASVLARGLPLEIWPFPFEARPCRVGMVWHSRTDEDAAQRWLRQQVITLVASTELAQHGSVC